MAGAPRLGKISMGMRSMASAEASASESTPTKMETGLFSARRTSHMAFSQSIAIQLSVFRRMHPSAGSGLHALQEGIEAALRRCDQQQPSPDVQLRDRIVDLRFREQP